MCYNGTDENFGDGMKYSERRARALSQQFYYKNPSNLRDVYFRGSGSIPTHPTKAFSPPARAVFA